jgi:predicted transcriptional regulator
MIKLLEDAITKVRELPDEDQEAVAAVMLAMTGVDSPIARLDDATRAAVRKGVAEAKRGEFVPDDVIVEADRRHGI